MDPEAQTFRDYHQRREALALAEREALRAEVLAQVRQAVHQLAPRHPAIRSVHLFGSLLQPGRFGPRSDVDLALDCDDPAAETPFWRDLEHALGRDVDLRPRSGAVERAVAAYGVPCYAREADSPRE
ncbi:MAG: nucleotidyltransferase domain-containing protein [Acidobacteriota bacterium]|nr:nucleotidyltransferase domain-containing protein [Acidobacteriota bacterium]